MTSPVDTPSPDMERDLLTLFDNEPESIVIRGREISMRPLNGHARHKLTRILLSERGREEAVSCKCLAAAVLNGYFKIKFLYWFLWRWYFYVRQYDDQELAPAVELIKKKVPVETYFSNTISLIAIRETMMQMNRKEVLRSLQEHSSGKPGSSAKSSRG